MLLKLVQRFVICRETILRDPEKLLNFLLKLVSDPRIETFLDLHSIVIDVTSHLLIDQKFSSKLKNCGEIIVKVPTELMKSCCFLTTNA